MEQLS